MDKKKIAQRWYLKGKNENDIFDKFIYFWIGFNALYGHCTGEKRGQGGLQGERRQIEIFCTTEYYVKPDALLSSDACNFFKNNRITNCNYTGTGYANTDAFRIILEDMNRDGKEQLVSLLLCVYQARCNLFHGDKMPELYDDREISKKAGNVLEQFLGNYFTKN